MKKIIKIFLCILFLMISATSVNVIAESKPDEERMYRIISDYESSGWNCVLKPTKIAESGTIYYCVILEESKKSTMIYDRSTLQVRQNKLGLSDKIEYTEEITESNTESLFDSEIECDLFISIVVDKSETITQGISSTKNISYTIEEIQAKDLGEYKIQEVVVGRKYLMLKFETTSDHASWELHYTTEYFVVESSYFQFVKVLNYRYNASRRVR